jgi:glucose 1-dehydrogenase
MRALAITPGRAGTARVIDVEAPEPGKDGVLIRTLEVGVCATDQELIAGAFGAAPAGEDFLILGHEFLGIVERPAGNFKTGDLVTVRGRRPCAGCESCLSGAPDACTSGGWTERGINGLHGFASDLVTEHVRDVVAVPSDLGRLGVLTEPTAVCERGLRHAFAAGHRQPWRPERAVVLGAGALGVLATFLLRLAGFEVWTAARSPADSPKGEVVERTGATYRSLADVTVDEIRDEAGGFDLSLATAGAAEVSIDAMRVLRPNGVACILGLDGHAHHVSLDSRLFGVDLVAGNQTVVGSVCSNSRDWEASVGHLRGIEANWPGALDAAIGLHASLENFEDALNFRGIKATLVLDES